MSRFLFLPYVYAETALASTSEARAIPTASYAGIPRNVTSIGVITAAALIPAKPVPRPAPIPARKQTIIVIIQPDIFNYPLPYFNFEALPALRALNGMLTLLLGEPQNCLALGALFIAVFLICQHGLCHIKFAFCLVGKLHEFDIFLLALVDILGKRPEHSPYEQCPYKQIEYDRAGKKIDYHQHDTGYNSRLIKAVWAASAIHKVYKFISELVHFKRCLSLKS